MEMKMKATPMQYLSSKTNIGNTIWLALVVMLGSWDIAVIKQWMRHRKPWLLGL